MTMHSGAEATFLIIVIGGQRLAINTIMIREILDPLPETRVPSARPFAPKVVNIRGTVVPQVTINDILNLPTSERTDKSRIVVVTVTTARGPVQIALLADAVLSVSSIPAGTIEPLSRVSHNWPSDLLVGLYRDNDAFVIVPDLEQIIMRNIAVKRDPAS
ncbi:hypothetical protein HJ526_15815 [Donghicola sp. C2-DW-16]|uniref:CheW-like domain-containing protein n=1 Tax=Donghicola mangrovi TaxID=2729614 RepID=A0A850QET9_9RHOB|nr:chemotaxis protein CheW [Donghicola mangrovi]NVO24649.1 hypothetical protein [Donghicola mangrovi]NVO28897.1 hypothetical protein [Donghicola mangrovi]